MHLERANNLVLNAHSSLGWATCTPLADLHPTPLLPCGTVDNIIWEQRSRFYAAKQLYVQPCLEGETMLRIYLKKIVDF
jgi:hypothetical protein